MSPILRDAAKDAFLESTHFRNFVISRRLICGASAMKAGEAAKNAAARGGKAPKLTYFEGNGQRPLP